MAATKASKKASSSKRPAPTIGDTAGAEFDPARTKEGEKVAQTGANPAASRAGIKVDFAIPSSEERPKGELGLSDLSLSVIDGQNATLKFGKEESGPLTQADLITIRKQLDAVIAGTS